MMSMVDARCRRARPDQFTFIATQGYAHRSPRMLVESGGLGLVRPDVQLRQWHWDVRMLLIAIASTTSLVSILCIAQLP